MQCVCKCIKCDKVSAFSTGFCIVGRTFEVGARIWNAVCNGARANFYNEVNRRKSGLAKTGQAGPVRLLRLCA